MKAVNGRGRPKVDQEKRRREILRATVALFSSHGYSDTNIQQVADHIGVAKGTIYLYFKTKEELFLAAVEYSIESLAETIDEAIKRADSPLKKIKAFIAAYITFVENKQVLAAMIVQEGAKFKSHAEKTYYRIYAENAPHLEKIIRDGVSDGTFRELNPVETTEILSNLMSGTMYSLVLGGSIGKSAIKIENITKFLLRGMLKKD